MSEIPALLQPMKDRLTAANMNRNKAGLARLVSRELPDWKVEV